MERIGKVWSAVCWPEKFALVVAVAVVALSTYLFALVILVAYGYPLTRLITGIGLWLIEADALFIGSVWVAANFCEEGRKLANGTTARDARQRIASATRVLVSIPKTRIVEEHIYG
jgi:hypothetical protein